MATWGTCDFHELKNLQSKLEKLMQVDLDNFCEQMAKEIAARLLRKVQKRTPVGSYEVISYTTKDGRTFTFNQGKTGGELRRNWKAGATVIRRGSDYEVEVYNPTRYAPYVEYGHRQTVGRFVPQIGKRLKTPWVKGQFMLTISVEEMQSVAPKLLEKRLNELLKGAFSAK